jgi:phospholipid-binding lipoprotein MlaA
MRSVVRIKSILCILVSAAALSACATPEVASGIYDPFEKRNRRIHENNLKIDSSVFGGGPDSEGTKIPRGVLVSTGNFASNWSLPGTVANNILQLNFENAAHNAVRFLVNTTIGIGGLFDPAMAGGAEPRDSGFGETLYVWGVGEGAYVELPLLGPSTSRDTVGGVVDLFANPLYLMIPAMKWYVPPAVDFVGIAADRLRYGDAVNAILYNSEDSYAQARLLYLENRRFQLGGAAAAEDELYDIYEEDYE